VPPSVSRGAARAPRPEDARILTPRHATSKTSSFRTAFASKLTDGWRHEKPAARPAGRCRPRTRGD
jgi:hypothetical protein